jgi:predicted ATPase
MLKKLTVHGFKSIERQTIALEPLNVLIGANGSGKSNLIDAVTFFQASALGERDILVKRMGGAGRILFHGSKTTKACFFSCEAAEFSYEQTLIPVAENSLDVASERLAIRESAVEWSEGGTDLDALERQLKEDEERHLADAVATNELTEEEADAELSEFPSVRSYIQGWRRYHLHDTSATAAVKSACPVDDNRYLRGDASNLAAYLYWLRNMHPADYRRIVAMVRLNAPYFEDFVLEPQRLNKKTIRLEWKQRQSDAYFDADSLSDGTLRFIGLATLLNQPKWAMPSLIVIDEPELGLHPLAIRLLAEMLDAAAETTQILVATQSVTLLDNFLIGQVIVADHDGRGSQFRRLHANDYQAWLENFSLGELWEKNVLGGRP